MRSDEVNEVGQAVFGYSNGHRLLTSSISLSSVDGYELAAASDLAPGAQITGSASYLTGFPLPDSKLYALIRTWLAPEMPRPGCVWSHVLLLDQATVATQIDLTVLIDLHRRPDRYASDSTFSNPIPINRRLRGSRADPITTEKVLSACYGDVPLDTSAVDAQTSEQAIFAIWSQQWPRLRRQFVFRSIGTTSELKGQFLHFKRGPSPTLNAESRPWLKEAVADATSQSVTPMRRFLWRYGKDIHSDRETLPELVGVYLTALSAKRSYDVADKVFSNYPLGQADTLKKDLLGLSLEKLSQISSVSAVDLIRLLVKHQNLSVDNELEELISIFSKIDAPQLIQLTPVLMNSRDQLGEMFSLVFEVILPIVDDKTVLDPQTPAEFVFMAVVRRNDLLTSAVIDRLSSREMLDIWSLDVKPKQRRAIVRALLCRPYDQEVGEHLLKQPGQALKGAFHLIGTTQLHESWVSFFRNRVSDFLYNIASISKGDELVIAANLFAFPLEPKEGARAWFTAFKTCRSHLSQEYETLFLIYLLDLSIRYGIENYRDVLRDVLSRLRDRILQSELPPGAENRLSKILPYDDARWDLNRRLLKLFRKAHRRGQEFYEVLDTLNLTDEEYAYATDQNLENLVRRFWSALKPWT